MLEVLHTYGMRRVDVPNYDRWYSVRRDQCFNGVEADVVNRLNEELWTRLSAHYCVTIYINFYSTSKIPLNWQSALALHWACVALSMPSRIRLEMTRRCGNGSYSVDCCLRLGMV